MDDISEMKRLIEKLIEASYVYYQQNTSLMSDKQYDEFYDRLALLEAKTGVILSRSPTQRVGHEVSSAFLKVTHKRPLLSLDKTKEPEKLAVFLGEEAGLLSWKLDGLTVVLNYSGGRLVEALTRGNGEVGEDITANAKCIRGIPLTLDYTGELSVRGEAVISFEEFERINSTLTLKYKNPRNLTSGTVRQLDSAETLKRNVAFLAFGMVAGDDAVFGDSRLGILKQLEEWGFSVVGGIMVDRSTLSGALSHFTAHVAKFPYPTDGLVLAFDSVSYGKSLGATSKFPRDSLAFKWADDTAETTLLDVEWNTSRTGLINPIAVFEGVELEGTTVSRASVHNVSVVREFELGIGDKITVYKANMIIPQIDENLTRSGTLDIPETCPACGGSAQIMSPNGQEALFCVNDGCPARNISFLEHFVSRNAMNIEGLSVSTLEKFVDKGFISDFTDIYRLDRYYDEIVKMDGFGEKSVKKLDAAIQKSRKTTLHNFIFALGIKNVGLSNAKLLCRHFGYDFEKITQAESTELLEISGFGGAIAESLAEYFKNPKTLEKAGELYDMLEFDNPITDESGANKPLEGVTVVITGDLNLFENRKQLQERIEEAGGKATSSVTSKTNYLINNDVFSNSSKNKKAKELGVPIVSEKEFVDRFFGGAHERD